MCGYSTDARKVITIAANALEATHDELVVAEEGATSTRRVLDCLIAVFYRTEPKIVGRWTEAKQRTHSEWSHALSFAEAQLRNKLRTEQDPFDALRSTEKELRNRL